MQQEKRYIVYNKTDGVLAHPHAMTLDEATAFVQQYPQRFARQGYYCTARWHRIRPQDVELTIVEAPMAVPAGGPPRG